MKRIAIGLVAVVLTGCATFKNMDAGLGSLVGQPVDMAIARLGYPTSETTIADRKVYIWSNAYSAAMPVATSSTTTGTVGSTPFSARTSGMTWEESEYSCVIRVFIDAEPPRLSRRLRFVRRSPDEQYKEQVFA